MRKRKKIIHFLVIVSVVICTLIFLNSFSREVSKGNDLNREIMRLEKEAEKLENRNNHLLELIKEFDSLDFLEKEARIKMGLKKPGEEVVIIHRATSTPPESFGFGAEQAGIPQYQNPLESVQDRQELGIWENPRRWYQYLFKTKD